MRTFMEIRNITTKDVMWIVKDSHNRLDFTDNYNGISDTYMGVSLSLWDDNFQYLKRNQWVLEIDTHNLRKELKKQGFTEVNPNEMDLLMYGR